MTSWPVPTADDVATDFGLAATDEDRLAEQLETKLDRLSLSGGALEGLGFSAAVSGDTVVVSRDLSNSQGVIGTFADSTDSAKEFAELAFTVQESRGGNVQSTLTFNKTVEAGDTVDITFNDGTNDKTFQFVVQEAGSGLTTGALVSGSNAKYVLSYEDVVKSSGGTAKTLSDMATTIANTLNAGGSTGTISGDINAFLGEDIGTSFSVVANGDSVAITDLKQASGNADTLVSFNQASTTGGTLDFDFLLTQVDQAETVLKNVVGALGAAETRIETQTEFIDELTKAVNEGIGTLVDADLAEESAKFQALQVQQQLGLQALSIANQQPQSILGLFQ